MSRIQISFEGASPIAPDSDKEEHPFSPGTTTDVMVSFIVRALRAEAGVRGQQQQNKPTGYYAGRRAGFTSAAASMASMLYGADYETAKNIFGSAVRVAGQNMTMSELRSATVGEKLATEAIALALNLTEPKAL